ncbi:hypothetical protein OA787_20840 [Citrobacter freundii]|nr:hypothetical protein [Citrobacter freundii]MDN4197189.1 hypothetical protein [Citrobacter freundii]MDN4227634.1 hypothetical protein [Citrobacter freundii]
MTDKSTSESYEKVPLLSNVVASGLIGALTLAVASWDGHFSFISADFSSLKPFLLLALPSSAMFLSHWIKSIGFKWSLGSVNRQLLSINKTKIKNLKKDIQEYTGVISDKKIEDFRLQLEQVLQDRHDIISNTYTQKVRERNEALDGYNDHRTTPSNDNPELQNMLENQNNPSN